MVGVILTYLVEAAVTVAATWFGCTALEICGIPVHFHWEYALAVYIFYYIFIAFRTMVFAFHTSYIGEEDDDGDA